MNKNTKFFCMFIVLIILLVSTCSVISAADTDDKYASDDDINTYTEINNVSTVDNDNNVISTKNSQNEISEVKSIDKSDMNSIKSTSDKSIVKDEKNIKSTDYYLTLVMNQTSGGAGDSVSAYFTGDTIFNGNHQTSIYWDDELLKTESITTSGWTGPTITFEVPDGSSPGEHLVMLHSVYGSRNYYGQGSFTVLKTSIDTNFVDVETVTGELGNTIIPITIVDIDDNSITGESTVTVKDGDNVLVDNYPIENGVASIAVDTIRTGQYDLTVEFSGNRNYSSTTGTVHVNVEKAATSLIVNEDDEGIYEIINVLNNTVITGRLIQTSTNKPISNAELLVTVDGNEYVVLTDSEGNYEYKYPVTGIVDDLQLTIKFNGNDLYLATDEISGFFDIEVLDVIITLDEDPLAEVNETTTITGSLTDNYNNPIINEGINLQITGFDNIITVTTDSEGKFSYDVEYNDVVSVTVTATVTNDDLYDTDGDTISFDVVVGPRRTNLILDTVLDAENNINIVDITPYFNEVITSGTLLDIFNQPVTDAKITIFVNDEDYSTITDNEGKFSLIYNATEGLSVYDLSLKFEGNENYKPANQVYTGTFKTEAFDIKVTIDNNFPDEILISDKITISGSATLQNDSLKNNPIVLTIKNTKYTTYTDDEGKYSYVYIVSTNGNHAITANATYNNANIKTASVNLFVSKPDVTISLNELTDSLILSDIELNGRVFIDSNNTGIKDSLLLKINDNNINLESDDDGYFTYTFTPEEIGEYDISIIYDNVKYSVKNINKNINVVKRQSHIISDKAPVAVELKDTFTLSGRLIDQTNAPIVNKEVVFIIDGERFTNKTDDNGYYSYNYVTNTVKDNILYEVRYSGDNQYLLTREYVGSFFDVESKEFKVKIESTKVNDIYNITGLLTLGSQAYDEKASITLYFDNNLENPINVETNEDGIFYYEYIPEKIGIHTVFAQYKIDDETVIKSNQIEFTVDKFTTNIEVGDIDAIVGHDISLTATVKDIFDNLVNGGKVVFKVNGVTIKDENSKVIYAVVFDGLASIENINVPESWTKGVTVTATYSGSSSYLSSKTEGLLITASKETLSMNFEKNSITADKDQKINLTTIINTPDINEGKIAFKINGKTIKDENSKVVYINVVNSKASYEYTIPKSTKYATYTITAIYTSSKYDRLESNMDLIVSNTINDETSGVNTQNLLPRRNAPNTYVITNDNIDDYITATGLTDLVMEGDILDIQGIIDKNHSLTINKPVNIISSTKDAVISLHTVAGSLMGEDPGNSFVVNIGASGSNISSLYLNNTECWMYNNYDVTLYNMTMYVKDNRVGSGVGQTAIRYCERLVIDSCYIYTENNGGSTSMALTGSSDVLIKNTKIEGINGAGQVGNILYLANTYNIQDKPSNYTIRNTNITVINSTIAGTCTGAITVGVYNLASNTTFINNTINTTGNYGYFKTGTNGVAIGTKLYGTGSLIVDSNTTAYNNVFYGTGTLTSYADANVYNNTIYSLDYTANGNVYNNTIEQLNMYSNTKLSNNVFGENMTFKVARSGTRISNVTLSNNTFKGNLTISGYNAIYKITNLYLLENNITSNISLAQTTSAVIANNSINGTIFIPNTATSTVISNNTIITSNQYAVSNSIGSTTVTDNYLISHNYELLGNDAVYDTARATITNNRPELKDFYYIAFDDITATVGEKTSIIVNVFDLINVNVDEGEVYLMINDEILVDENGNIIKKDVFASVAEFDDITVPEEWLRSDAIIQAVYISDDFTLTNTTNLNINKREATVEILTETLTVTTGQTVTFKAKVTDNNELINGQLAFKLNNHSLKDNDGKLISVNVIDGIATLEYVIDDTFNVGSYTLTAVFENQLYERSVGVETFIIE